MLSFQVTRRIQFTGISYRLSIRKTEESMLIVRLRLLWSIVATNNRSVIEPIEIFILQRNDRANGVLARVALLRRYSKTSIIRCKWFSGRRAATTRDAVDAANNEESSVDHSLLLMNIHGVVAFAALVINYVIVWIIWQRINGIKSTRRINNYAFLRGRERLGRFRRWITGELTIDRVLGYFN